eukprot:6206626-Pleurochrysis_carterae.AAC.3
MVRDHGKAMLQTGTEGGRIRLIGEPGGKACPAAVSAGVSPLTRASITGFCDLRGIARVRHTSWIGPGLQKGTFLERYNYHMGTAMPSPGDGRAAPGQVGDRQAGDRQSHAVGAAPRVS